MCLSVCLCLHRTQQQYKATTYQKHHRLESGFVRSLPWSKRSLALRLGAEPPRKRAPPWETSTPYAWHLYLSTFRSPSARGEQPPSLPNFIYCSNLQLSSKYTIDWTATFQGVVSEKTAAPSSDTLPKQKNGAKLFTHEPLPSSNVIVAGHLILQ